MIQQLIESTKNFLFSRQRAYQLTFNETEHADAVLKDLAKFCRATESTYQVDARAHAVLEGRREVWLRIQNHLHLDSETLLKTYGRKELL